jgi:hypothetical protein
VNLDPLEAEVLGWLLDDYEAPQTLAGDISGEFGTSVSEASVSSALVRLVEVGLAQAFQFDLASETYRPIALEGSPLTAWFMATAAGRKLVNEIP